MSWRSYNAPYALQQLADKLGVSVQDLRNDPTLVASAAGVLEGGSEADRDAVAQAFMAKYDKEGGGNKGLLNATGGIDSLVMPNRHTIGPLSTHANRTLGELSQKGLDTTDDYLEDLKTGDAKPVIPLDYTQNWSPSAAMVEPVSAGSWHTFVGPKGAVYSPNWARDQVQAGDIAKIGGEYFSRDEGNKPFNVSWLGANPQTYSGPDGGFAAASDVPPVLQSGFGRESSVGSQFADASINPALRGAIADAGTTLAPDTAIASSGGGSAPAGAFGSLFPKGVGGTVGGVLSAFASGNKSDDGKAAADALKEANAQNEKLLSQGSQDQNQALQDIYQRAQRRRLAAAQSAFSGGGLNGLG